MVGTSRERSPIRQRRLGGLAITPRAVISPNARLGPPAMTPPTLPTARQQVTVDAMALKALEENIRPVVDALAAAEVENQRLESALQTSAREGDRVKRSAELTAAAERAERLHAGTVHATELSAIRREIDDSHIANRQLHIHVGELESRIAALLKENEELQHTTTFLHAEADRAGAETSDMITRNNALRDSLALTVAELNAHIQQANDGHSITDLRIRDLETELEGKNYQGMELGRLQMLLEETQKSLQQFDHVNQGLSNSVMRLAAFRSCATHRDYLNSRLETLRSSYWKWMLLWMERCGSSSHDLRNKVFILERQLSGSKRYAGLELDDIKDEFINMHQRLSDDLLNMWKNLKHEVQQELILCHGMRSKPSASYNWKQSATDGLLVYFLL